MNVLEGPEAICLLRSEALSKEGKNLQIVGTSHTLFDTYLLGSGILGTWRRGLKVSILAIY